MLPMIAFTAATDEVVVVVRPVYLDEPSDPLQQKLVFGYHVRIENHGDADVQLLRRHWTITDGLGRVQEVEGKGVVGQQPVIEPGGFHEYESFCVLPTFEGEMSGAYVMERASGARFRALIPPVPLRAAAN